METMVSASVIVEDVASVAMECVNYECVCRVGLLL